MGILMNPGQLCEVKDRSYIFVEGPHSIRTFLHVLSRSFDILGHRTRVLDQRLWNSLFDKVYDKLYIFYGENDRNKNGIRITGIQVD